MSNLNIKYFNMSISSKYLIILYVERINAVLINTIGLLSEEYTDIFGFISVHPKMHSINLKHCLIAKGNMALRLSVLFGWDA